MCKPRGLLLLCQFPHQSPSSQGLTSVRSLRLAGRNSVDSFLLGCFLPPSLKYDQGKARPGFGTEHPFSTALLCQDAQAQGCQARNWPWSGRKAWGAGCGPGKLRGLGAVLAQGLPSYGLGLLLCLCPSQPWSGLNPGRCPRALSPCSTGPRQLVFTAYSQLWTKHSTQFSPPSLHKPEGSRCDFYCADEETEALRGLEVACS